MSLGWQCESALVPRTAKPIHVDGKSLVSLKALVYSKEQQKSSTQEYSQHRRHVRSTKVKSKHPSDSRQISTSDQNADEYDRVYAALKAKSALYDQMSALEDPGLPGGVVLDQYSSGTTSLIDFREKGGSVEHDTQKLKKTDKRECQAGCLELNKKIRLGTEEKEKAEPWAWSNGGHDASKEYIAEHQLQREFQHLVEEKVQKEILESSSARVKSQWEKTLQNSAKEYLDDIHTETVLSRASASTGDVSEVKRSGKDARRDLLRKKQEDRKQLSNVS